MAKKSKTQRAKASAARQARKEAREAEALNAEQNGGVVDAAAEAPKKKLFGKASKAEESSKDGKQAKAVEKKAEKKPAKKNRFQFFKDVRSEMKRVTWPSREDVLRWSGVVVVALLFFGAYVALLDNAVITPILLFISGLGA